jgi:lysozyme
MNKPNITNDELQQFLKRAAESITKTINGLVKEGRISQQEADEYLPKALHVIEPDFPVFILAIRGYYLKTMGDEAKNDFGMYDDAIIVIYPGGFKTFNGNTDPRLNNFGIAQLLVGLHYFKKGLHPISKPYRYDAFRTANDEQVQPVLRNGENGIKKGITINLHKGGHLTTNSAGCQTIFDEQWLEFQPLVYSLMSQNNQSVLPYLLIENNLED